MKLSERDHQRERKRYEQPHPCPTTDDFYGRAPAKIPHHHHPYHHPPPSHQQYTANRRREEPLQTTPRWVVTEQPKVAAPPQYHHQSSKTSSYQPQCYEQLPKSPYQPTPQGSYEPTRHQEMRSYDPQQSGYRDVSYDQDLSRGSHQQDLGLSRGSHQQDLGRGSDGGYEPPEIRSYDPPRGYEPTPPRYEAHHRRTRSMVPPSRGGVGYYDVASAAPLRRSTGMLRSECSGIEAEDYQTAKARDEYRRRSFRVSPTMRAGRVRRYGGGQDGGILRRGGRGGEFEGAASDTEAQEMCWTMGGMRRGAQSSSYGGRSNSLPRCVRSGFGRHQAVRFTTSLPYDSQEESDGAVSAPELPATRSLRRRELLTFLEI